MSADEGTGAAAGGLTDEERHARFRAHVEDALPRVVSLALSDVPAPIWPGLHRAFLHDGRVWIRAALAPGGATVQVLCGWKDDEPELLHTFRVLNGG